MDFRKATRESLLPSWEKEGPAERSASEAQWEDEGPRRPARASFGAPGARGTLIEPPARPLILPFHFAGRRVALRPTNADGHFNLCYRSHILMQIDLHQKIVKTVLDVPERVSSMSPV